MGRVKSILFLLLFSSCVFAQQDSVEVNPVRFSLGMHLTQAMYSAPAVAGQAKVKYNAFDAMLRYGRNEACINNIRSFDQLTIDGQWLELSLGADVLFAENGYDASNGLRLGLGFGIAKVNAEFSEVFESLPPYEDLVYTEKYEVENQTYLSFSCGYQMRVIDNVELGIGGVGFYLREDPAIDIPIAVTPFNARIPVGLFAEVNYSF